MDASDFASTTDEDLDPELQKEIDEGIAFIVEKIIDKRTDVNGRYIYRVRWEGYGSADDTWEPVENLTNCTSLLNDFNKRRSDEYRKRKRPKRQYFERALEPPPTIDGGFWMDLDNGRIKFDDASSQNSSISEVVKRNKSLSASRKKSLNEDVLFKNSLENSAELFAANSDDDGQRMITVRRKKQPAEATKSSGHRGRPKSSASGRIASPTPSSPPSPSPANKRRRRRHASMSALAAAAADALVGGIESSDADSPHQLNITQTVDQIISRVKRSALGDSFSDGVADVSLTPSSVSGGGNRSSILSPVVPLDLSQEEDIPTLRSKVKQMLAEEEARIQKALSNHKSALASTDQFSGVSSMTSSSAAMQNGAASVGTPMTSSSNIASLNRSVCVDDPFNASLVVHSTPAPKNPNRRRINKSKTSSPKSVDKLNGEKIDGIATSAKSPARKRAKRASVGMQKVIIVAKAVGSKIGRPIVNNSHRRKSIDEEAQNDCRIKSTGSIDAGDVAGSPTAMVVDLLGVDDSVARPPPPASPLSVGDAAAAAQIAGDKSSGDDRERIEILQESIFNSYEKLCPSEKRAFDDFTLCYSILDAAIKRANGFPYVITQIIPKERMEKVRIRLHNAVVRSNENVIEKLLNKYRPEDLRLSQPIEGEPLLFTCIKVPCDKEHIPCLIIDQLLASLVDINVRNAKGQTALIVAVINGSLCKVEKLLNLAVKIDSLDDNGESALFHAIRHCPTGVDVEIVKTLLNHGVDFKQENSDGLVAATVAAQINKSHLSQCIVNHVRTLEENLLNHLTTIYGNEVDILNSILAMRCLEVRAKRQWHFNFNVKELVLPAGFCIVLFASTVKFMGDGSVRFSSTKSVPIQKIALNGVDLQSVSNDDSKCASLFEPLNCGKNELTVHMGDWKADFIRVALQANIVRIKAKTPN